MASLMASFFLGFFTKRLLGRWQILDRPNERSSHSQPTPRGGGCGIMVTFLFGAAGIAFLTEMGFIWLLTVATGFLALVSFMDDRNTLPWWIRLGVHFFVAMIVAVGLLGYGFLGSAPLGFLLVLLFAGYANAFNFMDGVNGLASGQATVSAAGMVIISLSAGVSPGHPAVMLSAVLSGASGGFLPHNFPKARMFMGDVGSVPLGFLLMCLTAWLALDGSARLWIPLGALHAGFLLDTSITMLRRALHGERVHEAHRDHFYQRLVRAGWSHQAVTGINMMITIGVLAMWQTVAQADQVLCVPVVVATALIWLVYFVSCEWVFRRRRE